MHLSRGPAARLTPVCQLATMKAGAKPFNNYLSSLRTTVFTEMTNLANQHQSVNLGQGFPDDEGPISMKRIVGEAVMDPKRSNQYPSMLGVRGLHASASHSHFFGSSTRYSRTCRSDERAVHNIAEFLQYTAGIPELRQAAAHHSECYNGIAVDWQTEALVTVGATEALAAAFIGMVNEGDEVSLRAGSCGAFVSHS